MWPSSAGFFVFVALLSSAVLSLGTPVPQQAPEFSVHAASLEPEDDPARLHRYQTYGLRQTTVERVQPVSNVHPDAAPFTNVPDLREGSANSIDQSALASYGGTIQLQEANMGYSQAPATAPMAAPAVANMAAPATAPMAVPAAAPIAAPGIAPTALSGAVPAAVLRALPGAGPEAVPEERYNAQGDGMGTSTLSDNIASQTMGAQGASGIRDTGGGESDISVHYASQGGMNVSPASASSAVPEGAVTSLGGSAGLASPIQGTSLDSANAAEANVGAPTSVIAGAPTASVVGTSTVRQGIPEQSQENPNFYTSRMVEPAAIQSGQFNGQVAPYSQYGEIADASGTQAHSSGLGVSWRDSW